MLKDLSTQYVDKPRTTTETILVSAVLTLKNVHIFQTTSKAPLLQMSQAFSVSHSLRKWLTRKRKAYHRRKERAVSSLDKPKFTGKRQTTSLLRSQTVGCFSNVALREAEFDIGETVIGKYGVFSLGKAQNTKSLPNTANRSDRPRTLQAWTEPITSTPIHIDRQVLAGSGKSRKSIIKTPKIRVDKCRREGKEVLAPKENLNQGSANNGRQVSEVPDNTCDVKITKARPKSHSQKQKAPVNVSTTSAEAQVLPGTETSAGNDKKQIKRQAWKESEVSPSPSEDKIAPLSSFTPVVSNECLVNSRTSTQSRKASPGREHQTALINGHQVFSMGSRLFSSPWSPKHSPTRSRGSTPDSVHVGELGNTLNLPQRRLRRRSPSPKSQESLIVSGMWYSPRSSRTPSRERSSSEEGDFLDELRFRSSARRSRSARRRDSYAGYKPIQTNVDSVYRHLAYPNIPDVRPGFEPLLRFRRAVKTVQVLLRATSENRQGGPISAPSVVSWVQIHNDLENNRRTRAGQGLLFDPSDYRAKKEILLSSEAKAILSMDPASRTEEQLHVALVALNQSVESFSEFPIHMQESLVRVGFYEHFEAKRVIIRQGHFADNFYFLLSGMAIVTILETDKQTGNQTVRTAAFLKKGNSFGELGLMHGSLRSATVTCKEPVELLAVGRQDFIDIFMHVEKNEEPEHIKYLHSIDIFRGWPIEKLPYDNPRICLFTYFRRGVLLCKDSNSSDWVYIIKQGSCKVLKELKLTTPNAQKQQRDHSSNRRLAIQSSQSSKKFVRKEHSYLTCQSREGVIAKKTTPKRRIPWVRARKEDELKRSTEEHLRSLAKIYSDKHTNLQSPSAESVSDTLRAAEVTGCCHVAQPYDIGSDEDDITSSEDVENETRFDHYNDVHNSDHPDSETTTSRGPAEPESSSVFVQVTRLGPKDVFGLEYSVLNAMTSITGLSLVSDGAECILISKNFFMENLSNKNLKRLRLTMQPYPTEAELKQKLENQKNWKAYKTMALNDHLSFTRHVQETLSLYY